MNSQDIDSIETTLKWDEQFFEMDQLYNSTSDDEMHIHDNFNHFLRVNIQINYLLNKPSTQFHKRNLRIFFYKVRQSFRKKKNHHHP